MLFYSHIGKFTDLPSILLGFASNTSNNEVTLVAPIYLETRISSFIALISKLFNYFSEDTNPLHKYFPFDRLVNVSLIIFVMLILIN